MTIRYYSTIKNRTILEGIRQLLILCGNEFVPPLGQRSSATQQVLTGDTTQDNVPDEYFESIRKQSAFVALEAGRVVGFLSLRKNYVCREIPRSFQPNVYITTIIVHPHYRNQGITSQFYEKLMTRFVGYHIFTRTWSTNRSHTRILSSYRFFEHRRLTDDRGPGIDTVYYHHEPLTRTPGQVIRQYRLTGNLVFLSLLIVLTVLFLLTWLLTDGGIIHELCIAFSTSLIASALCLLSDSILKYRESRNDEYINTLKSFGIDNLQFHKDELLEALVPTCSKEIWISGYRLIMTAKASFRKALQEGCRRAAQKGLCVRILTVAPWSETFRLVYGNEDVADNYLKVLTDLGRYQQEYGIRLQVRMTEKPIFNDTYKVDDRFITGPYLHCTNERNQKITARDFFSLDINDPKKELYDIIYKDYMAVWDSADYELDLSALHQLCSQENILQAAAEEKMRWLQQICPPRKHR